MRRLTVGIVIMALLLLGSGLIGGAMSRIHRPIAQALAQAAEQAQSGDWAQAQESAAHAAARWRYYHCFTAAFADHTPMDEMDALLQELEVYARAREDPHFSATCAHLSDMAGAFAQCHLLTWWNLL